MNKYLIILLKTNIIMSLSRMYFGPGSISSREIRKVIAAAHNRGSDAVCKCLPASSNKKVYYVTQENSFGQLQTRQIIVNPDIIETPNERIANIIRYSSGGKIQFGNPGIYQATTFLGRTEGQPGGIIGPIKNKF